MALTDDEIEEIKFFLGYNNLTTVAIAYADVPAWFTTVAKDNVSSWAEGQIRNKILPNLRQIHADIQAARKRYKADQVGSITLNRKEHTQLVELREFWIGQLSSTIGFPRNPSSSGGVFTEVY